MAFETISEATKLWIKGREFTIARLLGDAYKDQAERYTGGALVIFRLAPQDYHRFHSPVDGTIGPMTYIAGEYYTVNVSNPTISLITSGSWVLFLQPQAIRTTLDVYGENARKIVPINSPKFGRVMVVCIGAMMVGSIKTTVSEGDSVKRGEELGYFAFGGLRSPLPTNVRAVLLTFRCPSSQEARRLCAYSKRTSSSGMKTSWSMDAHRWRRLCAWGWASGVGVDRPLR